MMHQDDELSQVVNPRQGQRQTFEAAKEDNHPIAAEDHQEAYENMLNGDGGKALEQISES